MTTISVVPYSALLNDILGQVSEAGHLSGDGMLNVLVHYKVPDKGLWAGPGFFNLATKHLGYHLPDERSKVAFWLEKRKEVLDHCADRADEGNPVARSMPFARDRVPACRLPRTRTYSSHPKTCSGRHGVR